MRTVFRLPVGQPFHLARRPANRLVVLGVVSLAGALATWRGAPPAVVVPVGLTVLVVVAAVTVRSGLRRASARIDAILREELGPVRPGERELAEYSAIPAQGGSAVEERVELERREGMVDDHGGGADDACPIARARLDDAQLRGGQRQ